MIAGAAAATRSAAARAGPFASDVADSIVLRYEPVSRSTSTDSPHDPPDLAPG
jgi:hypothetical protein